MICSPRPFLDTIRCPAAGCIGSTWCSALASTPCVGNILAATLMGGLFMLFYQRSGSLRPVVLSHYLADVADFA